ncbi:putative HTH-type transcriptional regulator YdeC [Reticulibacter mediterranei]|uniref:Putative HTH-type transcriptional regulator YdeC n=1 Tax=Reticulibacter mediterranei TaxID=2778369 RepID=A0A8J3ID82_9CHLR|nr:helix-turn-helix domain-containing protein [Reticulibacter mediterranei]GHO90403.1 putative HTH-type transcriptional regulator YdeC [Reticulibacter mediterranei]
MFQLTIRDDLSEAIDYTSPNVPIRAVLGTLSHFPNKAAVCHWHSELECIIVLEGEMHYFVNEQVYRLSQGMGIIVNTNRLHFGYGVDDRDCVFVVLLLHPSLLGGNAYIESHYINPLLYDADSDAILLSEGVAWHREALHLITTLFQVAEQQPPHYEFQVHIQFASLWLLLYEHTIARNGSQQRSSVPSSHLKDMIGYIQKHYQEKISLHDIALAGLMCRSKCCHLFKQTLHQTPFEYLLHYRIQKSLSLLADGNLTITAIAAACGFSGASYYTEVFRKIMGISPSAYRKRQSL